MATWNELANKVLSKEDVQRIDEMKNHAELEDNSSLIREVLWRSWEKTSFAIKHNIKDTSEEYILNTSLELLVEIYKGLDYQAVMNKLDYAIKE